MDLQKDFCKVERKEKRFFFFIFGCDFSYKKNKFHVSAEPIHLKWHLLVALNTIYTLNFFFITF